MMSCVKVSYKDVELENVHVAIGAGILFGVGVAAGWLLSYWHILYVPGI